jgi:hypothetical protein
VRGLLFSVIAALGTSTLWVLIVWGTGYSLSLIAILIGVAAGLGMRAGCDDIGSIGGVLAAAVTFIVIMVAKFISLEVILAQRGYSVGLVFHVPYKVLADYFFTPTGIAIIIIGILAALKTGAGIGVKT